MQRDYALITNLLQASSLPVVRDWLAFLPYPPKTIVCYCGYNEETKAIMREVADEVGANLIIPPDDLTPDIRKSEFPVLRWQFAAVEEPYALRVSLDTIPYEGERTDWFNNALDVLEANDLLYITGATRNYRADRALPDEGFLETQRVSLNFFIIRPEDYVRLAEENAHLEAKHGRYVSEGFLEDYCAQNDLWGMRMENRLAWRVFHVQVWDERINAIREAFRSDTKVARYLTGFEDDFRRRWDTYFMWPKPPFLQRIRIYIGQLRRQIFSPE